MNKLTKEQAARISALINGLTCWHSCAQAACDRMSQPGYVATAEENSKVTNAHKWFNDAAKVLEDEFGIVVHTFGQTDEDKERKNAVMKEGGDW